ncbi:GTPase IMAP family member 4 [Podospora conica]|nr:GTPase IMAP family member 4 [Schizothecium conicum]
MAATDGRGNRDVLIALLGLTGAGKTTFTMRASGNTELKVGHSIYPCTQDPQAVRFALDGRQILLIDTPGFDDDDRSDVEILEDMGEWMSKQDFFNKGATQLDGLILLHPVTMHRVGGSERRRTRLLQNLLGKAAYKRIVIATTMWERLRNEEDVAKGIEGRKTDVWADLLDSGATYMKHYDSPDSAHRIIRKIIELSERHGTLEPLIKNELAKNRQFVKTTAGKSVKTDLEDDLKRAKTLLEKHDRAPPRKPQGADKVLHRKRRKEYEEWLVEKQTLEKRVERIEARLVKVSSNDNKWSILLASCTVM